MSNFTVLVVEDDPPQREVMAELLKDEGYEVVECSTAEAAELVIATSGAELQAVVTDQNLEGAMTGAELARFALEQFPQLKVLVISGNDMPLLPGHALFMQKPVDLDQLLVAVRD